MSRCGFRSVRYLEVKICCKNTLGSGRFSEVANVLQVWDFQSVTRTLSALGSVSASCSVRFSECPFREVLLYSVLSQPRFWQCFVGYT